MTTNHLAVGSTVAQVKRTSFGGSRVRVTCPPLVPDYQRCMGGVDRGDQLIACYILGRHSKKWWKRVFSYLLVT